ncbi:MAG TPA: SIMPL domain-containing protein [Verrucomicrobiae bacterium]|nr:SIMPL domain-containing protein [Verrucomicrobiae bacterium]
MKKVLVLTVLVMGSSLAYCSPIPEFPFVFTTGRAEKEVPPNTATMTFSVKAFDEVSSNAVARVTSRSAEVMNFLGNQGFGKSNLVAYELSKQEVRETKEYQVLKILGYDVSRQFELTFDDLSKYDLVAETLFKMDNVSDIRTDFGRKDRKEIEASLVEEACADAKGNAVAMGRSFGRGVGTVHCISQEEIPSIGSRFGFETYYGGGIGSYRAVQAPDKFLFIPANVKFQKQVWVVFKLKEE